MGGEAGFTDRLLREVQVVQISPPKDHNGVAAVTERVSLKDWDHVTFVILSGAWAGGAAALTLQEASDVAGTGEQQLALANMYTNKAAPTSPALVKTAVASDTFDVDTANAMWMVEVEAAELSEGFPVVRPALATPGANADLYTVFAILSKPRDKPEVARLPDGTVD